MLLMITKKVGNVVLSHLGKWGLFTRPWLRFEFYFAIPNNNKRTYSFKNFFFHLSNSFYGSVWGFSFSRHITLTATGGGHKRLKEVIRSERVAQTWTENLWQKWTVKNLQQPLDDVNNIYACSMLHVLFLPFGQRIE